MSEKQFAGRVAIVTGGTRGIGRAIVLELGRRGADVAFNYAKSAEAADSLKSELDALGVRSLAVQCDVANTEAAAAMVQQVKEAFGRIDFLVNAAGVQARGPAIELSDEDWEMLHAVNLRAVFRACRAAARRMVESQNGGAILNVASVSSTVGVPGIVPYGAMKGGVVQLTRGLAVELAPHGVRVNAVAPGYVSTAMTEELWRDEERRAEVTARIPLGRFASPEEISPAALFLLSPAGGYITGEVLHVDGGYVAR